MKEELTKINFPDYIFSNVNIGYLDLVEKNLSVVDKIAPFKDFRIKNNTKDWFDDKVAEAIKLREKCLKFSNQQDYILMKNYIKNLNSLLWN